MTPEEQRIAIAEGCGWKSIGRPSGIMLEPDGSYDYPHDYLNDLNAMHETEATLTSEQRERFVIWLSDHNPTGERLLWNIAHATAAQRAEAFLRTIGRWKDE